MEYEYGDAKAALIETIEIELSDGTTR
jgi:hypothetical protein